MFKSKIKMQIARKGKFTVSSEQFSDSQCGFEGCKDYTYEVEINTADTTLIAPQMFIIDNLLVEKYFIDTYEKPQSSGCGSYKTKCKSCEVMALEALAYFKNLFKTPDYKGIKVYRIMVRIGGSQFSAITAEWKK